MYMNVGCTVRESSLSVTVQSEPLAPGILHMQADLQYWPCFPTKARDEAAKVYLVTKRRMSGYV